jgi:pimeloyl-ACP methyl ester carboxylesterase
METHFRPAREIKGGFKLSQAIWSREHARNAVLFVHGFRGDALRTWGNFPDLLIEEPSSRTFDFVFYGYDAFSSELNACAVDFAKFLKTLILNPAEISNTTVPSQAARRADHKYTTIYLVGHSLGAVVMRLALLQLREVIKSDLNRVRMILFAPAHCGAYLAKLLSETLSPIPILNLAGSLLRFSSPLIDQLMPGSDELKDLKSQTTASIATDGEAAYLVAKKVAIARKERIVKNLRFCADPTFEEPIDAHHVSICKPKSCDSQCFSILLTAFEELAEGSSAGG